MQKRRELQDVTEKLENLNQSDIKSKTMVVHLQKSLSKLHADVEWPVKTIANYHVAARSPRLTKIHFSKSQDLQLIGEVLFNEEDSFCQFAKKK
jgi:hypothetical protein